MSGSNNITFDDIQLPGDAPRPIVREIPDKKDWNVQSKLSLQNREKEKFSFVLFNDSLLSVNISKGKKKLKQGIVDLSFLDTEVKARKHFSKTTIILSALFMLISPVVFLIPNISPYLSLAPFAVGLIVLTLAMLTPRIEYEFQSAFGHTPLFSLLGEYADREKISAFATEITSAIEAASALLPRGKKLTPIAVTEYRRLYESGLLTAEQYELAKKHIFSAG